MVQNELLVIWVIPIFRIIYWNLPTVNYEATNYEKLAQSPYFAKDLTLIY